MMFTVLPALLNGCNSSIARYSLISSQPLSGLSQKYTKIKKSITDEDDGYKIFIFPVGNATAEDAVRSAPEAHQVDIMPHAVVIRHLFFIPPICCKERIEVKGGAWKSEDPAGRPSTSGVMFCSSERKEAV